MSILFSLYLGEHEEIGDCGDNESDCSEEDDEADKVLAARCRVLEDDDGDDHPTEILVKIITKYPWIKLQMTKQPKTCPLSGA